MMKEASDQEDIFRSAPMLILGGLCLGASMALAFWLGRFVVVIVYYGVAGLGEGVRVVQAPKNGSWVFSNGDELDNVIVAAYYVPASIVIWIACMFFSVWVLRKVHRRWFVKR